MIELHAQQTLGAPRGAQLVVVVKGTTKLCAPRGALFAGGRVAHMADVTVKRRYSSPNTILFAYQ